ncbi:Leucine Rich Repeat [Seminavis robusta]|uniref:Leucine Rich Repeat n=1 Tax=Seminavis robusta TaxID=568900 RepID=A0A9N8HHE7_9STRA|nr:Leucine Rich Repeat [Seminavis robusta]|eukprot:Sro558_g166360.1 Leucine Rich Repeat (908) ;mRNA; r:50345-53149
MTSEPEASKLDYRSGWQHQHEEEAGKLEQEEAEDANEEETRCILAETTCEQGTKIEQPKRPTATATTTATATAAMQSTLMAEAKRSIAYPKKRMPNGQAAPRTSLRTSRQQNQQEGQRKKADASTNGANLQLVHDSLLAHEKRQVVFPKCKTSSRNQLGSGSILHDDAKSGIHYPRSSKRAIVASDPSTDADNKGTMLDAEGDYPPGAYSSAPGMELKRMNHPSYTLRSVAAFVQPMEDLSDDGGEADDDSPMPASVHSTAESTSTRETSPKSHVRFFFFSKSHVRLNISHNAGNHNFDEADHHEIMPMPTSLQREIRIRRQLLPGAFAEGNNLADEQSLPWTTLEESTRSQHGPMQGLAVAQMVSDDPEELQNAAEFDADTSRRQKEKSRKQFMTKILLSIIAFIAILMILITILIPGKESAEATSPPKSANPSSMPSQMPTTFEGYLMSLLPEHSELAIDKIPDSPQSKAWQWLLKDSSLPNHSKARIKQQFALATLYFATGGDSWNNNDNWLDHGIHECNWYNNPQISLKSTISHFYPGFLAGYMEPSPLGHCDKDGMYQHLWLDQNNLVGSLPQEFYLLTTLESFSLGFNSLQGQISTLVGELTALGGLFLSTDGGTIPTEIGSLSNLEIFNLWNCNLQGTIPTELWQLTKLDTLSISHNYELQGTIPTVIGALSALRWLVIDQCDLFGTIPTQIGLLQNLEWLTAAGNRQLSGTLPSELGQLSNILVTTIFDNSLVGTLPSELGMMTTLNGISLWGNLLVGQVPSELGLLTQMTISLNFHSNSFSGTIPTELGLLSLLHELEFQGNKFTGRIPSEFGQLSSIGHLTFANNSLSGQLPTELAALQTTLHTLTLEGNLFLSGTIPEEICILNGTCISSGMDTCNPVQGLFFECSDLLCGCGCHC